MFDLARDANPVAEMTSAAAFASAEPASVTRCAWVRRFAAVSGVRGHKCTVSTARPRPFFSPLKSENRKATTEDISMESCWCRRVLGRAG